MQRKKIWKENILNADEQQRILLNEKPVLDKIPRGRKENTYFLIEKSMSRQIKLMLTIAVPGTACILHPEKYIYYIDIYNKVSFMSKVNKQYGVRSRK